MRVGSCPNCGAQVEFRSRGAAETVCPFCRSLLLARDASLERIGLAADPPASSSLIRCGSGGVWSGKSFSVVGRILYESENGTWSDWHIVFKDGSSAWLPDERMLYAVVFPTAPPEPLRGAPDPDEKRVFRWKGTHYYVTAVQRARRIGREGELPWLNAESSEVVRATLAAPDGSAGFILYGGATPQLFLGESVEFEALHFTNLRPEELQSETRQAQALNCPRCGGTLALRTGGLALSLACGHCLSVFDATRPELAVLRRLEETKRIAPLLPMGAKGTIAGDEYEVVGFQVRTTAVSMGAILYDWHQYVLFHPLKGFRFVEQARGHWSESGFLRAHPDALRGTRPALEALGHRYEHFSTADAETVYVQGEFPWRLVVDTAARVTEFTRPPFALRCDSTQRETMWFVHEYRTGRQIWDAFRLGGNPPDAEGIAVNQPSPYENLKRQWALNAFLLLMVLVAGLAYDTFLAAMPRVFWAASLLTLVPSMAQTLRIRLFERRRWQGSDYNPKNARYREAAAEPYIVSPYTHEPQ